MEVPIAILVRLSSIGSWGGGTRSRELHRRPSRVGCEDFLYVLNLAIALLRLAGAVKITATTRWVGRDATRAAALLGV